METLLRTTTPIKYPGYKHFDGHSTGFFYRTMNGLYLVTARHCLFQSHYDPDGPFEPDQISIRIREKLSHTKTRSKQVSLYDDDGDPRWIEPYHHEVDMAALPLDISLRETGNTSFGGGSRYDVKFSPQNITRPGESAIVAGYPILEGGEYAPVLRDALISSSLDVDHDEQPYFLIDSKLHQGTSGSPVLIRRTDKHGARFTVIGVHTGQYDMIRDGSENLNQAWFMQHLRTRLNDIEPGILDMW